MKFSFSSKTLIEAVGDIISGYTEQGDTITVIIVYDGPEKPRLAIKTKTYSTELKQWETKPFDLTSYLPETFKQVYDELAGTMVSSNYFSWTDYIEEDILPKIAEIADCSGRQIVKEVVI